MASVSISHLILFIASLTIAAGVVGTMTSGVERVNAAVEAGSIDASDQIRTDITVISDAGSPVYNSTEGNLTLLVKNTGTERLPPDGTNLEVLVDGQFIHPASVHTTLLTGTGDSWAGGDVMKLEIEVDSLGTGDHRAKLTINSKEAVFRFRIS
ncbi:archaellum stator protein ArlG [Haloparvum sp. AD34]